MGQADVRFGDSSSIDGMGRQTAAIGGARLVTRARLCGDFHAVSPGLMVRG